ncbi:MAG: hypothetical protein SGPRY_009907, partial [Prymnesium sp.]
MLEVSDIVKQDARLGERQRAQYHKRASSTCSRTSTDKFELKQPPPKPKQQASSPPGEQQAAVPSLKMQMQQLKEQVQHLKDELAKAKEELAQEKSSVESRIANAQITSAHASAHEILEKYKEGIRD